MKKNIYKFITVGFEISITVLLFFFIGLKINQKTGKEYYVIIFSFLGIIYSLYTLYKKVKKG